MRARILRRLLSRPCEGISSWPEDWRSEAYEERRHLNQARTRVGAALLCAVILLGVGTRTALLAADQRSEYVTWLALGLAAWTAACGGLATRTSSRAPAAALVLGAVVTCCTMIAHEGGLAAAPWPSLMLILLGTPLLFPVTSREMAALSLVTLACFYVAAVALQPEAPMALLVDRFMWLTQASVIGTAAARITEDLRRQEFASRKESEAERAQSERLLLNVLPETVAARLKSGESEIADGHDHVSVLFADLVGFTELSARCTPAELVAMLDRIVKDFDRLAMKHGLEKIKTIGDCYMVAAGIPEPRDDHAEAAAAMAVDLLAAVRQFNEENDATLEVRVGLHCGPVVAGVIGEQKFAYDLWGDTVNTASRMESHGVPGRIQVTEAFTEALPADDYELEPRGEIEVKGKGGLRTFLLRPRPAAAQSQV